MLLLTDVFDKACSVISPSIDLNPALLEDMCFSAASELEAKLHPDFPPSAIPEVFVRSAAFLAVANYLQFADLNDFSSVKAGNLSISRRGQSASRANSAALRKQAETLIAPFFADSYFDFRGVRG